MFKKIGAVVGGLIVVAGLLFAFSQWEGNLAKADDVRKVEEKTQQVSTDLKYYVLKQQARDLQRRIWDMEEQYGDNSEQMREYKCLQRDLREVESALRTLK